MLKPVKYKESMNYFGIAFRK